MALAAGTRLGPYEILEPLGAGGMGEVYRARDPRLGREVAVKVLPEHVAKDPETLARFEREARTAAGLNDPHICSLHDVGTEDDIHYAVFELLEGETLRERLSHGALPASKAVELATQMCQGLAAAHAKGIVHRDLKPENLFVTRPGLKILDFGLAKLRPVGGAVAGEEGFSREQTLSAQEQLTSPGTAPGTVAYMSPEQARGEPADARSDIFATGVVLFEMLSGQRPFRRGTQVETLAAILNEDPPDLTPLSGPVAPGLERVVRRCLQKDPEDRFQSARDVTFALEAVSGVSGADRGVEARRRARSVGRWMIPAMAIFAAAALLVGAGLYWNAQRHVPPASPALSHFVLTLQPGQELARGASPSVAISPDGTHVAYAAGYGADTQLYLRARDEFEARPMPGTDGARGPFFSPDSEWVGFYSNSTLFKLPVGGGRRERICDASWSFPGASWGADGTIVFGTPGEAGLWRCPASGGSPETLTRPGQGQRRLGHPQILPDGDGVLFTVSTPEGSRLAVLSLESGKSKQLDELGEAGNARYLGTGHLVYGQAGRLLIVPFDLERLEAAGPPIEILGGVFNERMSGIRFDHFALSEEGTLVYVPGSAAAVENVVVWVRREGGVAALSEERRDHRHPRLSPDGRHLAVVEISGSRSDIWLYDIERESRSRLTTGGNNNITPVWTPDGERVSFFSDRAPSPGIYWKSADGVGDAEPLSLPEPGRIHAPRDWSPDGGVLLFEVGGAQWKGRSDLWVLPVDGDRTPEPFMVTDFNERTPRFSPDGRWVAYISDETGPFEVYVRSHIGPPGKWTISIDGGTEPVWSADGRELFYRDGDQMMVADISTEPDFAAGKPRVLFEGRFEISEMLIHNYDVSRDGSRFVMIQRAEGAHAARINVILNWFDEVRRELR